MFEQVLNEVFNTPDLLEGLKKVEALAVRLLDGEEVTEKGIAKKILCCPFLFLSTCDNVLMASAGNEGQRRKQKEGTKQRAMKMLLAGRKEVRARFEKHAEQVFKDHLNVDMVAFDVMMKRLFARSNVISLVGSVSFQYSVQGPNGFPARIKCSSLECVSFFLRLFYGLRNIIAHGESSETLRVGCLASVFGPVVHDVMRKHLDHKSMVESIEAAYKSDDGLGTVSEHVRQWIGDPWPVRHLLI